MTIEQQGAETNGPLTADGTARVRATSATARATLPVDPPDPTLITAELPAVARASRDPLASRYADPDRRRGGINKREPAPVALRIVVWSLFFVFLVALAGVLVADLRPDWLSFVRNDVHNPTVQPPTSTTTPAPARSTTKISVLSSSSSLVSYSVPATSYSIVIETAEACWTTIHSPIGAATFLFAHTIPANSSKTVTVSTTAQVITSNTVKAIRIMSGTKKLGSIPSPKPLVKYTFTPSGS